MKVKAPPKPTLKFGFLLIDMLHISICLWGLIIYWKNYSFIRDNYYEDKLILVTCPLLSGLGCLSIIRLVIFILYFFYVPRKALKDLRKIRAEIQADNENQDIT